ncbi:MAG: hypothetical protein KIS77_06650 [Saprospiraceae bacterium]|nr:hypothetical protein [Saprospiraceae bacterium]
MKYLFLFLLSFSLQLVFAQESSRRTSPQTSEEWAAVAVERFQGRLGNLRAAIDDINVSSMVRHHADLLGDVRATVEQEARQASDGERLASMQVIFDKLSLFIFDPEKPEELKAYLPEYEAFLVLLRKSR